MSKYFFMSLLLIALFVTAVSDTLSQTTSGKQTTALEEAVKLETLSGNLYGTLLLPQSKRKMPVVLLIAGSGPTDRDGNSPLLKGANNSLKLLAEDLAAKGIASLRYDKRGVGESGKDMFLAAKNSGRMPREEDLNFDNFINDAVMWS